MHKKSLKCNNEALTAELTQSSTAASESTLTLTVLATDKVTPPKDVLRHAEDRINRLDPFVSEEGEPCDAKQSVERIHLQEGCYIATYLVDLGVSHQLLHRVVAVEAVASKYLNGIRSHLIGDVSGECFGDGGVAERWYAILASSTFIAISARRKDTAWCCETGGGTLCWGEADTDMRNKSQLAERELAVVTGSGKVCLIPLPEGKAVDEDDAVLHQGLGSDQLVVGGIVDHINDPGLASVLRKVFSSSNPTWGLPVAYSVVPAQDLVPYAQRRAPRYQGSGKVCLIPLPEGKAVDEDDAVLHQGLGSDQLVVGGIVDHPSLLHQADELAAVLVANRHITATGDELHHLAVAQQGGVHQLLPKPKLIRLLVQILHGVQQAHLNTHPNLTHFTTVPLFMCRRIQCCPCMPSLSQASPRELEALLPGGHMTPKEPLSSSHWLCWSHLRL
ncbi:hypothetical protein EYF80_001333 [Liparis tanakae]|uniref:Uncharacterized protein n=1 Tax=Liparis tanakae TaxID=230148 RepID=A0A4Z2JEE1_9TELE|nr:hypothetical protein EYF80_001333 [Liparis tanakae]